ncbi:MAG: hypothetical protein QOF74_8227, partial [Caballeronia mineralivorans]|nr:hypothetical protein [Caballeronia mineralivorans]
VAKRVANRAAKLKQFGQRTNG